MPVEFALPPAVVGHIDAEGCLIRLFKEYRMEAELEMSRVVVGARDSHGHRERSFPALRLVARGLLAHSFSKASIL